MQSHNSAFRAAAVRDIPLLVISCDRYRDVWPPFFALLHRFWPDCPFPIYLGTNFERFDDPKVTTLNVGEDRSWTTGVRGMLDQLDCEYLLVFLEDFFLERPVDTQHVLDLTRLAVEQQLGCLRLIAGRPLARTPTYPVPGRSDLGVLAPGELYRVSAQVSIWRKATLEKFLIPGANAWEFEVLGSALSRREPDLFWAVYDSAVHYDQVIEKGKWKPKALKLTREAGVSLDLTVRPQYQEDELARHLGRAEAAGREYAEEVPVKEALQRRQRWKALTLTARILARRPKAFRLLAKTLIGLIGPVFLEWFEWRVVDFRVRRIRRRVAG